MKLSVYKNHLVTVLNQLNLQFQKSPQIYSENQSKRIILQDVFEIEKLGRLNELQCSIIILNRVNHHNKELLFWSNFKKYDKFINMFFKLIFKQNSIQLKCIFIQIYINMLPPSHYTTYFHKHLYKYNSTMQQQLNLHQSNKMQQSLQLLSEDYPESQHIISSSQLNDNDYLDQEFEKTYQQPLSTNPLPPPQKFFLTPNVPSNERPQDLDFDDLGELQNQPAQKQPQPVYRPIPRLVRVVVDHPPVQNLSKFKKKKKNRKIRTTITREKLSKMNEIFGEYTKNKEEGKNPRLNLKQIGNQLSLGYSTILHKFREYRSTKVVKGGALIASLQKKRKYKKSLQIEEIIDRALADQPFYTAVQLSQYIERLHNKSFSRSIISRHLGQMGYSYKNLKSSPIQKNKPIFRQTRRVYANILSNSLSSEPVIIFIDQLACSVSTFQRRRAKLTPKDLYNQNPNDYVSLIVGATPQEMLFYHIKSGFYTPEEFQQGLQWCLKKVVNDKFNGEPPKDHDKIILITDMNKIHLDPYGPSEPKPIKQLLNQYHARRIYLPPASPHLNPLESIFTNLKTKLFKKEIHGAVELLDHMKRCMDDIGQESVQVYFQDAFKCLVAAKNQEQSQERSNDGSSHQMSYNNSYDRSK